MELTFLSSLAGTIWLPVIIFLARVLDVTIGTIRIIFVARGKKYLAPLLGFVETFIWILIISQIVTTISGIWSLVGYAAGFAAGTLVGIFIEERLAIGTLVVRTILSGSISELVVRLREAGFGVTCVPGQGAQGPVTIIYTIIKRKDLQMVVTLIHTLHPRAFLSIEELSSAHEGIFPPKTASKYRYAFAKRK